MRNYVIGCLAFLLVGSLTPSLFTSCGKIELPDVDDKGQTGGGTKKPVDTVWTDTLTAGGEDNGTDSIDGIPVLNITAALKANASTWAFVQGYVVGGVLDNSFVFGTDFSRPNTALLLADSPGETVRKNTFAVALKTGVEGLRETLNLYDHPEWLGRKIRIFGLIEKYYSRNGCKAPDSEFAWLRSGESDTPGDDGGDDNGDIGNDDRENNNGDNSGNGNSGNGDDNSGGNNSGNGDDNNGGNQGNGGGGTTEEPALPELKDSVGHVESGR